ncbi:hypothetical protein UJY56_27220, partial [Klebsiella pneumoniae]|nr:hypothetical protein [Klebsiella pneumoniae]
SAQIREILINESAWEEMTCLFALSLSMVVGLSKFNRQLDTYRFKEKGIEVVMQRAASDDNSEAIMSFIMPDVNNMTLLVKNNGYIIVKTTCWLTKTDKQ